jgi:hypothetical protein
MSHQKSNHPVDLESPQHDGLSASHSTKAISAISLMEPDRETSSRLLYCGRHLDGRFRLKIDGEKFLVNGAIYALSQRSDHEGKPVWLKLLLDITPGYRITKNDELSFDVICANTGARMMVMGQARPVLKAVLTAAGTHV